ncbi:MAG: glycosyltransferase [Minisyncoccia bacterium]
MEKVIPSISFVVCTYNGRLRLPKVLDALAMQDPNAQVIVVDNASTDQTGEWVEKYWAAINGVRPTLKVISEPKAGLLHARISGIKNADAPILMFVDDDNILTDSVYEKVKVFFEQHPLLAALGGKGIPIFEEEEPSWFQVFQNSFACGEQFRKSGFLKLGERLWGACLCLRTDIVKKIYAEHIFELSGRKGKELFSGEDGELVYEISKRGFKSYYYSELAYFHFMPKERMTVGHLTKMYIGFGLASSVIERRRSLLIGRPSILYYFIRFFQFIKDVVRIIFKRDKVYLLTVMAFWKGALTSEILRIKNFFS